MNEEDVDNNNSHKENEGEEQWGPTAPPEGRNQEDSIQTSQGEVNAVQVRCPLDLEALSPSRIPLEILEATSRTLAPRTPHTKIHDTI